jgi:hypothetical protein
MGTKFKHEHMTSNISFRGNSTKTYPSSTLASSTLIILFSEMLKILKIISSKSKNIVKDNSEHLGIFYLLK